jgi:pimeloyl-ACP methyl ester carboxylesterase
MASRAVRLALAVSLLALPAALQAMGAAAPRASPNRPLLEPCKVPGEKNSQVDALCGLYEVWENRATRTGRKIGLKVVVLPALGKNPKPDPILFFGGGPGEAIAEGAGNRADLEERQERDLIFINQRGTGEPNRLGCDLGGTMEDVQTYLGEMFPVEAVSRCRDELAQRFDLTLYGTATAMDDVDEIRAALGYSKVNLWGSSYGTRSAQVYLRRHGETVRSALLRGVVPMEETAPSRTRRPASARSTCSSPGASGMSPARGGFPRRGPRSPRSSTAWPRARSRPRSSCPAPARRPRSG